MVKSRNKRNREYLRRVMLAIARGAAAVLAYTGVEYDEIHITDMECI